MRPTASIMLQQNNNNNYPCLNMSGSAPDVLQKCPRSSLPFPSRLELGLGDLPLIRGLRAWTLCSKNRLKAGGLLKGGQAPTAPPAGHKGSQSSSPRPADVYLSGEWGHMAYGLPAEADGKAGIRALVTVATLKTSEGSGKTQTHCLFLQTEKGSCLYSTAKPLSVAAAAGSSSTTSSLVGEWLKGKTGARGNRDGPARRKEQGSASEAQSGAGRVRVRSGRRWRKSSNPSGQEGQRSGEKGPAGEMALDERPEERNKDSCDRKQPPSPGQDIRRGRSEKQAAFRALRCCHSVSPSACTQCGGGGSLGAESPKGGVPTRPSVEAEEMRQRNEEEEEEENAGGGLHDSSDSAALNSDFERHQHHPESLCNSDVGEMIGEESSDERISRSQNKDDYSENEEDAESAQAKTHTGNYSLHASPGQDGDGEFMLRPCSRGSDDQMQKEAPRGETAAHVNGLIDEVVEAEMEELKEEERGITRLMLDSACCEEPSPPAEGSTCDASSEACVALAGQKSLTGSQRGAAESGNLRKEELHVRDHTVIESEGALEERDAPVRPADPSPASSSEEEKEKEEGSRALCQDQTMWENRGEESREQITELGVNPEEGDAEEIRQSRRTCNDGKVDYNREVHTAAEEEKKATENCTLEDKRQLEESSSGSAGRRREDGDAWGLVGVKGGVDSDGPGAASAAPSPCPALLLANPAPSAPFLGSRTSSPPCVKEEEKEEEEEEKEAEEEEEERVVKESEGAGEEERRKEGELEEQSYTVATEERSREEQEEEEEEEEDEFGVFMQAEGESAWSEGSTTPASVPCWSGASAAAPGNDAPCCETTGWTSGWTDGSLPQQPQPEDAWTAFTQEPPDQQRGAEWWAAGAAEQRGGPASRTSGSVFAEAFPLLPAPSSSDCADSDTVPTLTQLLRGRANQEQALLDGFHDLNKMICQRFKRASGVSRELLLRTLQLEQPDVENRAAPRNSAGRRLSPGLPALRQHAHTSAAKRRLSYDYNRNVVE